jgi:hypothetical protein
MVMHANVPTVPREIESDGATDTPARPCYQNRSSAAVRHRRTLTSVRKQFKPLPQSGGRHRPPAGRAR